MTAYIQQILFVAAFAVGVFFFAKKMREIIRNIKLGRDIDLSGNRSERFKKMLLIAFGQKKMFKKPIPALFHLIIYVGFIIINIEIVEIILDGLLGTHRLFLPFFGQAFYGFIINTFELLALGVIVACVVFLIRRHMLGIKRFQHSDLKRWPKLDADIILVAEIILMGCFLFWNAADQTLQAYYAGLEHPHPNAEVYVQTGTFYISSVLMPLLAGMGETTLIVIERAMWWGHIIGILAFLNYIPYSKHFHIMMAFPNTYFSRLQPQGKVYNMPEITREIELMLNPDAAAHGGEETAPPAKFGAKDVQDLNWKHLMDAYACTECGRCTAACPANLTGKLLSPRKIMMDTRDRLEEVGRNIDQKGKDYDDGKTLLGDYISVEELRACTTCNACVEECPVNINPLDIIVELRRSLIMEDSNSPNEWNIMFNNIENNAAPWQFSQQERMKWAEDLEDKDKT